MRRYRADPRAAIQVVHSYEARTISTDDRYVAKTDERQIAPDMMRPQIDSSLIV